MFSPFVSSGDGRKQCQQPYRTHQPLRPFELSCTVPSAPPPACPSTPSSILLPATDRYICGPSHLRYNLPHLEGYAATIGGTRVFFDRPITSGFTSSPPPFRSTWKYVVTDRRTLFPRLLTVPSLRNSLSRFLICLQHARFVGVLLTSCARETRGERMYVSTRVYVSWGIWGVRSWRNLR